MSSCAKFAPFFSSLPEKKTKKKTTTCEVITRQQLPSRGPDVIDRPSDSRVAGGGRGGQMSGVKVQPLSNSVCICVCMHRVRLGPLEEEDADS